MTLMLDTQTATKLIVSIADIEGHLPAHQVLAYLSSINTAVELALTATYQMRSQSLRKWVGDDLADWLRVRSVKYGSDPQIVFDINALLDALTPASWGAFLAMLGKVGKDASVVWLNISQAAKADVERKKLRGELDALADAGIRVEPTAAANERMRRLAQVENDSTAAVLKSLLDAVSDDRKNRFEDSTKSSEDSLDKTRLSELKRYVSYRETELISASETFRTKEIRIELE